MLEKYIKAALKETECDVLLKNGKYVNLFDGELFISSSSKLSIELSKPNIL